MKLTVKYVSDSGKAAVVEVDKTFKSGIAVGGKPKSGFVLIDPANTPKIGDIIEIAGVEAKEVELIPSTTDTGRIIDWLRW